MSVNGEAKPIRVFVHLAKGFDARRWQERWTAGRIIGINERMPYGYFRAAEDGCEIVYSEDKTKNQLEHMLGSLLMLIMGVDVVHAWRNRKEIYASDVVWTHTEMQYLAILLLFRTLFWRRRPKLIAQSVWLFDHWYGLSSVRRWILSRLIAKADILTFLSPENLKVARGLFPGVRSEFVQFGINTDKFAPLKKERAHHPVRLLSLGNDPHRDWPALINAVRGLPDYYLRIASKKVTENEISSCHNIELLNISSNDQLFDAFDWADLVAVALKPNLHASGITVLEEAAVRGVAIICTDTGGLKSYFSEDEIYYVPGGDPAAIQRAILRLSRDDALRWKLAERAQQRMRTGDLNSRSYVRRHAELSRELLEWKAQSRATANARGKAA
jgi:glycosyltransferase involved in cell wall biosynthesis